MPIRMVFFVMSVASAIASISIAVVVDTRKRPAARLLAAKLMQIAVLGAAGVVAILGVGSPVLSMAGLLSASAGADDWSLSSNVLGTGFVFGGLTPLG